ncbi:PREDICTED: nardilysin-like isoform X2 [Nicrophorus vespilloides]|uniref:Nardilysin-like isoform X2 n=1 Tax=Nicrophorus vespilloides TaxID=110193 RepID=A0ABM1MB48_NICVS|nr:PREDICTED: nardilysin-like isoform X2 [Nicrophorus vespilloides]
MSKHSVKNRSSNASKNKKPIKFEVLQAPQKSERDLKEYKVIKLENGLTACLISDVEAAGDNESSDEDYGDTDSDCETESDEELEEEEDEAVCSGDEEDCMKKVSEAKQKMAATALCIGVGSFSDPKEVPGMAHFLEHMVFMGSEKYPKENDFDKFITKRGGSDNASTDCETTTFYFECLEKYLEKSLDKFAQFFVSPLLKKTSMTREREAIDSEFQMAIPSDSYRKEQLLTSFFNPSVPVNQFSWGNLITLKDNVDDDKLYKALHEFRKRHYSAHRMTLCIQARLPMETLQNFVMEYFSNVPSNQLLPDNFKQYSDKIYDTEMFNKIYYIIPMKNVVQVDLIWALPSLLHLYKSKPHQYISWLLGDEGKGSLMSYLRKKVWAMAIYTGNGETGSEHNSMYAYFTINLVLTEKGLEHFEELVTAVFAYINLLRKVGPQERIFKEIQTVEQTSFTFADEKLACDMVESVSENMQFYPSTDYLTGSELYFEYKPDDIQMVLNYLRPDKMNVMVMSNNMPAEIHCDQEEPWFKTQFAEKDIPNKWLETWTNVEPYPEFSLPSPNRFLTTNFSLLPKTGTNPEYPVKVLDNSKVELWYKVDEKFDTPTAFYFYNLISPIAMESPTNATMMDMFISLLTMQITEEAYPAQVADLQYTFSVSDKGMSIKMNGFDEKLPILLELITEYLVRVAENMTVEMFNAVKQSMIMIYHNKYLKPSNLNKDMRLSLLLSLYWTSLEKREAVDKVDFDMMKTFAKSFLKNLYIQALIQGNVTEKVAVEATQKLIETIGYDVIMPSTYPKIRVVEMPKEEHCLRVMSFNPEDCNSYVTNYYQSGPFSVKNSVIIDLIMMIIEEPLFDVLRTKEQLGYNVFCALRDTFGILGFSITVNTQATKHTTGHIDGRIEAFCKHVQKLLKKMTDKKFNQFKRDLIKVKQCSDTLLKEEVSRHWNEIISRDYMFNRVKLEIKAIEELKASEMKKFWEEHCTHGNRNNLKKLTIQVIGHKSKETAVAPTPNNYNLNLISDLKEWKELPNEDYYIRNIEQFKHNLYLYPSKSSQNVH